MNAFSPALAAANGTSLAELSASYGWRGLVLAASVMAVVRLGGHIVGALSARALAPSQRQLRWLLKHSHVAGQLTAQQAVELTQATHAWEMQVRQAAPSNVQPPTPLDSGTATPDTAVPEATPGADDGPAVPRAEALDLLSRSADTTGP